MNNSKVTSVNKNFFWNLLYEVIIVLSPLIVTPYISRVLGVELLGVRGYTFAILTYFELFSSLGIAVYGQREIAKYMDNKDERSKIFLSLMTIKTISFSFVAVIYCVVFFGFNVLEDYKTIFLIWLVHLFESLINIVWYFQGIEKFRFISIRGIVIRIIQIVITIVFVKSKNDFYLYLFVYGGFPTLQAIVLWPFMIKSINWKMLKHICLKSHLKNVFVFFVPAISITIYSNVDKIMLGSMTNSTQTGYYESAQHIVLLALTIFSSVYAVMRSRISYELNDEEKVDRLINYFIRIAVFIVFPLTLGLISVSNCFVFVFFGEEYIPVGNMLIAFCGVIFCSGISNFISAVYIVPFNKQKYLTMFYLIATIINVILNFILIPRLLCYGAIIGSICSEMIVLIGCIFISKEKIKLFEMIKSGWKYILSSLIMFVSIFFMSYYLEKNTYFLIIEVFSGISIYLLILFILRDDIIKMGRDKISSLIRKKRGDE